MRKNGLRFCSVAGFLNAAVVCAQDQNAVKIFSNSETFTYTQNLPIDAWLDNLHAPNPTFGEYALTRNATELGVEFRGFAVSAFARRDYYFHFSNDTFTLFYNDKNHIKMPEDGHYDVLLNVAHVDIQGGRLSYQFAPTANLSTKITLGIFSAEKLLFGELAGYISNRNNKLSGDMTLDYDYTKDVVLKRPLTAPGAGNGASLDVEAFWQPRDNLAVRLLWQDLYGYIDWRHAPYTEAVITTTRSYADAAGNSRPMPTTSGKEWFRDDRQRLPKHSDFSIDYRLPGAFSLGAEYARYGDLGFKRLTSRYHFAPWLSLGLGYDLDAKAPRIDVQSTYLSLMLSADTTDVKAAKYLNASLGVRAAF